MRSSFPLPISILSIRWNSSALRAGLSGLWNDLIARFFAERVLTGAAGLKPELSSVDTSRLSGSNLAFQPVSY